MISMILQISIALFLGWMIAVLLRAFLEYIDDRPY